MKCVIHSSAAVLIAMALMSAGVSFAAGSGSIVFDPTNYAQTTSSAISNLKTANEAIQQTRQQIIQTSQQLLMAKNMVNNIRGMDMATLLRLVDPQTAALIRNLDSASADMTGAMASMRGVQDRYTVKMNAAATAKKPLQDFLRDQMKDALAGNAVAQRAISRDQQALNSATASAKAAMGWRSKIGDLNDNLGGAMQMLNTQLSGVVASNAEMLSYMAKVNSDASQANDARREVEKMRAIEAADARTKEIEAKQSALEEFKRSGAPDVSGVKFGR